MSQPLMWFTPTEQRLMRALVRAGGSWVPHETLVRQVWGDEWCGEPPLWRSSAHCLRVNVSRLRRKLKDLEWDIESRPGWYRAVPGRERAPVG